MRPVLVGENNPYGPDEEFALWPAPVGCAGWRLCHEIFGMDADAYCETFQRVNLLYAARWSAPAARASAAALRERFPANNLVLLGARVQAAFGYPGREPFSLEVEGRGARRVFFVPHPSGRNRIWDDPASIQKARALLPAILGVP